MTFHSAIDSYVAKDKDIRKFELDDTDWETIKMVSDWLKAFRTATTEMSTTKKPMLSKTLAVFRGLQETIRKILTNLPYSADPCLRRGLVDAHAKLSDYYYKFDESSYYTWAACKCVFFDYLYFCLTSNYLVVLDPRISFKSLAKDYEREPDLLADIHKSKSDMADFFKLEYPGSEESNTPSAPASALPPLADGSPQKIDFLSRYTSTSTAGNVNRDELDEYYRITMQPVDFSVDPLEWWHARREQFPRLYRMTCDILCIPGNWLLSYSLYIHCSFFFDLAGSAVAVERIFSGGRDAISLRRASLKADTIQALMLVKGQLRLARIAVIEILGDD